MDLAFITTTLTYEFLIISIVLNFAMGYSIYRGRKIQDKLQKSVNHLQTSSQDPQNNSIAIKNYLKREIAISRDAIHAVTPSRGEEKNTDDDTLMPMKLRSKWLKAEKAEKAEKAALDKDGNININTIHEQLQPLYQYLSRQRSNYSLLLTRINTLQNESDQLRNKLKSARASSDQKSQTETPNGEMPFSDLHRQIFEQRQTIFDLHKRLRENRSPLIAGDTVAVNSDLEAILSEAELNTMNMAKRAESLEGALQNSKDSYNDANEELQKLKSRISGSKIVSSEKDDTALIVTQNDGNNMSASLSSDAYFDIQQVYENSREKFKQLQDTNTHQRRIILKLETELSKLHEGRNADIQELIEKLKQQLRDSELCTATLESETEDLHKQIINLKEPNSLKDNKHDNYILNKKSQQENELQNMQDSNNQLRDIIDIICSMLQQKNHEKLAINLLKLYKTNGLNGVIYIKGPSNKYWTSTQGGVSEKEKKLLISVEQDYTQPWITVKDGELLLYNHCRFLFKEMTEDKDNKALLSSVMLGVDSLLESMEELSNQKQEYESFEKLATDAHKALQHIAIQATYQSTEGKKVIKEHLGELQELVGNIQLSDNQKRCATEMIRDHKVQMELLFEAGEVTNRFLTRLQNTLHDVISPNNQSTA